MKFIPNNLVRQVTFGSTTDVIFPRFSCTHVITTWGCHAGTTLSLSSGTFPSNISIVGRLRSGANNVSELPLEAVHNILAVT